MYFYVDESGHTGNNLFDEMQPILYYGVLSSDRNVNDTASDTVLKLRRSCGVDRLHATELGNAKLRLVSDELVQLQEDLNLVFDFYRVVKKDYALIAFFDQVFDHGINPAMTWVGYWTPMRYLSILKLQELFDLDLLKLSWKAQINGNENESQKELSTVCETLRSRVQILKDSRLEEVFTDILTWASEHPKQIQYEASSRKERNFIAPNSIGFQIVLQGIAQRAIESEDQNYDVIVDQQKQFNTSQQYLADIYRKMKSMPFETLGPGLPKMDFRGMPQNPLSFKYSGQDVGLELVDVYLWLFTRFASEKDIPRSLYPLLFKQFQRGVSNEISLRGIAKRWNEFYLNLPVPTENGLEQAHILLSESERRRKRALKKNSNAIRGVYIEGNRTAEHQ